MVAACTRCFALPLLRIRAGIRSNCAAASSYMGSSALRCAPDWLDHGASQRCIYPRLAMSPLPADVSVSLERLLRLHVLRQRRPAAVWCHGTCTITVGTSRKCRLDPPLEHPCGPSFDGCRLSLDLLSDYLTAWSCTIFVEECTGHFVRNATRGHASASIGVERRLRTHAQMLDRRVNLRTQTELSTIQGTFMAQLPLLAHPTASTGLLCAVALRSNVCGWLLPLFVKPAQKVPRPL